MLLRESDGLLYKHVDLHKETQNPHKSQEILCGFLTPMLRICVVGWDQEDC